MRFTQLSDTELESALPPAYIRLPKWGQRCPHTGLTRTALDQLTRPQPINDFQPPVRSKIFKMTGQKSGVKLIDYRSLRIYLDRLPDGSRHQAKEQQRESAGA
jgi:hypothetical protein